LKHADDTDDIDLFLKNCANHLNLHHLCVINDNYMKRFFVMLIFNVFAVFLSATDISTIDTDTLHVDLNEGKSEKLEIFIPSVFISYGVLTQVVKPFQQLDHNIDREVSKHYERRKFDNYIQYAPVMAVYGLDWVGINAKHNFRDRTFIVITSHLIMGGSVQAVKMATGVERPDGSNRYSFPSGHTATAFTGAHILFREYRESSPWISITGYATATLVGVMRILNRKHWVSDVVTGAGVGILSVEIGYLLLPVFHRIIGVEETKTSLAVAPVIGNNQYGLGMFYVF